MFSGDKSEREKSIEKLKYSSGVQILLGAVLVGCAITAVVKMEDFYLNYHIGGFTCGISGFLAGILGVYSFHKASSYKGDDPTHVQKELQCIMCIQMILGFIVIMGSLSGVMMNIMFLAIDYESNDDRLRIHLILSVCILVGIVLLVCATFYAFRSVGTCCNHGYNQRMQRTYPNTGTTGYSFQNSTGHAAGHQPVYSTGGFNAQPYASYPVSQFNTGSYPPPQPIHPPPYGFQQDVLAPSLSTAPPPAYPY